MPTKRRRHAITETPEVEAALDELRAELGEDQVKLGELVILGAGEKLAQLSRARAERGAMARRRKRLADRIRNREPLPIDLEAAEEVRRTGWARG